MVRILSTRIHGVIDYVAAITLILLPWVMPWSFAVATLLSIVGASVLVYSLLTRYELGLMKVLPMKAHLALDALGGVVLLIAAFILPVTGNGEQVALIIFGLFEIGAALITDPHDHVATEHNRTVSQR